MAELKTKIGFELSDSMTEIIDAVKFMEHIKYYDKPLYVQRAVFALSQKDNKKYLQLQVLEKYFLPFDLENLKQMISELEQREAENDLNS